MYKQYKLQQEVELSMREQGIIASSIKGRQNNKLSPIQNRQHYNQIQQMNQYGQY
jgi:hypothetical protein